MSEDRERESVAAQDEAGRARRKHPLARKVVYMLSILLWAGSVALAAYLWLTVKGWNILPDRYMTIAMYVLIGIHAFLGIYALFNFVNNRNKILADVVLAVLCAALTLGSIYLPKVKGQVERAFTPVPTEGTLSIDVFTLKTGGVSDIQQLAGQTVGIQESIDLSNQDYAIKVIDREITGDDIVTKAYPDIYSAVEALYAGQVAAIMINESYVAIIADNADFTDFEAATNKVYQSTQSIKLSYDTSAVSNVTTEPFIMLVAGRDTYSYDKIQTSSLGRSDVVMLLVVNPANKQILIVTVPRDSYVALGGDRTSMDKITHSTVYGIDCLVRTVNAFLGVKVNYFVRLNFQSVIDVVDAMGGITVDNPYEFTTTRWTLPHGDLITYKQGVINLTGWQALHYARERHLIRDGVAIGDEGRNMHQTIVMQAMIKKVTSVEMITHIGDLLQAINGTFTTDMNMNDVYALAQMQLDEMVDWDVESYHLTGKDGEAKSYAMGRVLDMKFITKESVAGAQQAIAAALSSQGYHPQ